MAVFKRTTASADKTASLRRSKHALGQTARVLYQNTNLMRQCTASANLLHTGNLLNGAAKALACTLHDNLCRLASIQLGGLISQKRYLKKHILPVL